MILRPGEPAIAVRAADHELARGVHVELVLGAHPAMRQHALHERPEQALDLGLVEMLLVLGGDHHAGRRHRLAVDVAQRHLALRVRQQPGHRLVTRLAQLADAAKDQVRVMDRRRHQRLGLGAGVAEHDALVAGALILVAGAVHALRDVG